MNEETTFDIPYVRLQFRAEVTADTRMPETKTAALRGGMGEMLLRQNCVTDRKCDNCRFSKACVVKHTFYSYMEKKPDYVTGEESIGYLIECSDRRNKFRKGDCLEFTLLLFGESIVFFNMYLQAFCQLGMVGIGKDHAQYRIIEVRNTRGQTLVRGNEVDMSRYCIETLNDYIRRRKEELRGSGRWNLVFVTPLSMKYRQKFLQEFCGEALVSGAARRVQMLDYYMGKELDVPDFSAYPESVKQTVREECVRRYSGTQDARMKLYGITGQITFDWIPEECLDYLIAGELTHIGKNSSFGFGKYRLYREKQKNI